MPLRQRVKSMAHLQLIHITIELVSYFIGVWCVPLNLSLCVTGLEVAGVCHHSAPPRCAVKKDPGLKVRMDISGVLGEALGKVSWMGNSRW